MTAAISYGTSLSLPLLPHSSSSKFLTNLSPSLYLYPHDHNSVFITLHIHESISISSLKRYRDQFTSQSQMSQHNTTVMNEQLSKQTLIFGLRLWVVLGVCVGAAFVILLFLLSLWLTQKRNRTQRIRPSTHTSAIPIVSRDIQEIKIDRCCQDPNSNPNRNHLNPCQESEQFSGIERQALLLKPEEESPIGYNRIHIEIGKDHRILYPERFGGLLNSHGNGENRSGDQMAMVGPEVSHLGWGHWYTLRELEASTNGFADENVIGEGGYGIVYHGLFEDNSQVAVKNLLNNRGQAEKEFEVEVEAIGRVRHKNLVRLLGYCAEGAHRMLVYEYVNNGNLEQWLHGDVGPCSPLTWEIRMNIILGTAKGLTYLHEGLEPKVVHRDIKSSNILLDKQWNPKVSDFGLAKLLGSETSYITTRVMGTFGYVAPEYASTGMLNERSDVYSFGILIMEIISGRNPVDYGQPTEEVKLVEWLKKMVANRNPEGVLDPKLPEKPSTRALKRTLLVALRCVDPNAQKRPKMGHVVHMLEAEESPFRDDRRAGRDPGHAHHDSAKEGSVGMQVTGSGDSSEYESGVHANEAR
ncbi:probable serine/threonine-protein kinase At1g01540 [Cornus florida]|uniref:probable serine/threonine-protein kinase At1g01540 n=1 Tax=Cornus florida TaxID=4283 RepID=UPI0028A00380|nr:probable serine/threonine-protein kinase At1g01540 [Cornus florida]